MPGSRAPDVSVVLVDSDDDPILPPTFDALTASMAGLRAEIAVIDRRTSLGRSWAPGERLRVLHAEGGEDTAHARLRALATTDAPVVAFLDAAAVPDSEWLRRALHALAADDRVAAVSAACRAIGEPTVTFTGNVGQRKRLDDRHPHDVLFPIPEAGVFRRDAVVEVGGFSHDLAWSCAVVDVGWRLTLAGYRVVLDPSVVVQARCSCQPDSYSGLVVVHSCLGEAALSRALPASLLVATDAADRFIDQLADLIQRRRSVQGTRIIDDSVVLSMMGTALEPAKGDESRGALYDAAASRYDLHSTFQTRQRVLIVTPDLLAARMAGPAIRAWQIAEALAPHHEVHLASTATRCEIHSERFEVSAPDDAELAALAAKTDIIVVQGFAMEGRPFLRDESKIVVVDLYDPLHLEQLELFRDATDRQRRVTVRGAARVLNEQLVRGDYFVCASAKQRDFWLGHLAALGRINHLVYDDDNRLENILEVVPFGLPDEPPHADRPAIKGVIPGIGLDDEVILWGGGIYNWFDPLTLIRAVDRLKDRRPTVRLFFLGLQHPNPDVSEMRVATEARWLARELSLTNTHVFFNEGWVPYAERQNYLLDADVAVSTHYDHIETEFSFRTRVLDYIWAMLPVVVTTGDWLAELISREGLGLVVPAEDVAALEAALFRALSDGDFAMRCRTAMSRVRSDFAWSQVLRPLLAFCDRPRRAPDLVDSEMRASLWSPDRGRRSLPWDRWHGLPGRVLAAAVGGEGSPGVDN